KDKEKPFLLYLAYNAPHTPIQPPADWLEKVTEREAGITEQRAKLVALIEHMDHGIGEVLSTLRSEGLNKNTIVVFTSDNGGQTSVGARNYPLHGGKQDMWEGGIRVCTCVSWPGKITPAVNKDHISLTMDFYPTLAEMAGNPVSHKMDGRSFAPVLRGEDWQEPQRDLFWVRLEGNAKYGGIPYHAVRSGDWKLLRNTGFEPYQMFNLANDPGETKAVPRNKAPKKYNDLFNSLMIHINHAGKYKWQRENP
ncbi:MAG: sulfatase-like hydrolase/transferase, partial [Verrucomicrobiales bacterium]|nr:sulfatase-like hydrolase/transferase [Verrucomicrobiales bacterium]